MRLPQAIQDDLDVLKIGEEAHVGDARDLLSYAAFGLCQAVPLDGSAGDRMFSANNTNSSHDSRPPKGGNDTKIFPWRNPFPAIRMNPL